MATNSDLRRVADNLRVLSASMVEKAKSGHPGGAMGGADFMAVLYGEFLRYDPSRMDYPYRDRFFLDPGHMSPLLYATLALAGYYSPEDLQSLRQWGSATPGHPEVDVLRGVENTSGPLGQGHAMALGAAIAERFLVARFGDGMGTRPTPTSRTEASRRRSRRAWDASPAIWAFRISSCTTTPTTCSSRRRWTRWTPRMSP